MEPNGNLSLDEQVALIENAERAYEKSSLWQKLKKNQGKYAVLHHPYTDLASVAGEILLTTQTQQPSSARNQKVFESRKELVQIILGEGGTLTFDSEFYIGYLNLIAGHLQKSGLSNISRAVWEQRVIRYVQGIVPILKEAASLEDTPENEKHIGYMREDLLDRIAFTQAYLIAKMHGLEAVKLHMPQLQEGKIVYNPNAH